MEGIIPERSFDDPFSLTDRDQVQEWAKSHWAGPFQGFGDGEAVGKCGWNDPWTCLYA